MAKASKRSGEVNLTVALERLAEFGDNVSQSGLSRYATKYASDVGLRWRGNERVLVWEKLRKHRQENARLSDRPGATPPSDVAVERSNAVTRNVAAQAALREHELAQRAAKLMHRTKVADTFVRAVRIMHAAVERAAAETAADIAGSTGADEKRVFPHLRAHGHRAVEAMTRVFIDNGYECGLTDG